MGSFLEKPITEKDTDRGDGPGMTWGLSSMQGWRIEMEDAHCVHVASGDRGQHGRDFPAGMPGGGENCFFGVFDGHGGSTVSKYLGESMLECIASTDEFKAAADDATIARALARGHMLVDENLLENPALRELQDVSGSTAITALVTADKFHVANCGDSRAVLARGGGVFWGSEDHKPNDPEERGRIEKAGGTVSCKRVDGDLAVSRSLGDFSYKQSGSLPAEEQKVSADPVVTPLERNAAEDEFLILACDGIWDVMTNESCAAWIRERLQQESDLGRVCEALLDHCLGLNSRDNMSVAIVVFPACKVAATGVHYEEGKTDSSRMIPTGN